MNCDWVQQNITLYLYNELADDAHHELQQHVARCTACAAELSAQQQFQSAMSVLPVEEVSPSFVASARMKLQESLELVQPSRHWYQRFSFDPATWMRQVRFSPALAAVIFMVGFGGGIGATYRMSNGRIVEPTQAQMAQVEAPSEASISGITSIQRDPNTNQVKVQYDKVMPESVEGTVTDPKIQDLLLYAAKSNENSGVRLNSVDALKGKSDDPRVRETLTYSLRYDSNPGVRLQALEGLGPLVKDDIRVRNAVLEALLNDSNLGVRSGALHSLEPVKADSSVRMALQQLAKEDPSDYIRHESQQLLASTPNMF
ncbi:MAG: HEAT repeat domain-containing protein [Candidatus Korobacteraceae bacterium]